MVGNLREFSVPWTGKDLGATLKRASEVAGGNLGNGGATAGDVGAPPVITAVQVRPWTRLSALLSARPFAFTAACPWTVIPTPTTKPILHYFLVNCARKVGAVVA